MELEGELGLKHWWGTFAVFDCGVVNNVDDVLLISLAVTCDQQPPSYTCNTYCSTAV